MLLTSFLVTDDVWFCSPLFWGFIAFPLISRAAICLFLFQQSVLKEKALFCSHCTRSQGDTCKYRIRQINYPIILFIKEGENIAFVLCAFWHWRLPHRTVCAYLGFRRPPLFVQQRQKQNQERNCLTRAHDLREHQTAASAAVAINE